MGVPVAASERALCDSVEPTMLKSMYRPMTGTGVGVGRDG